MRFLSYSRFSMQHTSLLGTGKRTNYIGHQSSTPNTQVAVTVYASMWWCGEQTFHNDDGGIVIVVQVTRSSVSHCARMSTSSISG
jgi:hypothetical protein